ncbi:RHS repeat-associated core domain-containing protein [Vibrio campbellii]|nr:RHS repeat-associated core domain-containing protein [Vibrio campbellii]
MMLSKFMKFKFLLLLLLTIIPRIVSAAQVYVISDFRNDVILEVDTKGKVLKRNYYKPFGVMESSGSTSSTEETGFSGQRYNHEVELVYMGARHYDPVLRRFLEPDKYEFDEGIFNVNKYNYADNNPYKYGDPSGNVIETLFDVAMLAYDIYHGNWVDAGYDVVAIVVPGLPAGLNKIDDVAEATIKLKQASNLDKVSDVGNSAARSPINSVNLNKQLGSQQQLGEAGVALAGAGSKTPIKDTKRLVNEYGGNASDWSKRSSSQHTASDGRKFETHWYENTSTGQRVEQKTIVQDYIKSQQDYM